MATPPNPAQANPMMQQAQQAMTSPIGAPAPSPSGTIDTGVHPVVARIVQALANAANAYGWTGMSPQEREQRTQLQSEKAETMARLAQTGAYQQGELANRGYLADIAAQNAATRRSEQQSKDEQRKFQQDLQQQAEDRKQSTADFTQAIQQGKLDQAQKKQEEHIREFENNYALAKQKFGDEQARTMLMQRGLEIRQEMVDVMNTALNQKGTAEGMQAIQKLSAMQVEHPLMTSALSFFGIGMPDVATQATQARGAGIPGTTPAPTTGAPAAMPGTAPAAPTAQPPSAPKAQTAKPKKSSDAGLYGRWTPNGIQRVGQQ